MKNIYTYSFRITLGYFLLGILWISASDYVLELLTSNKDSLSQFQSYKGWFYVSITSIFLYLLASKYEKLLKQNIFQLKNANNDLMVFLYKASHDLKGPIASILGLTNLLKLENPLVKNMGIIEKIESSSYRADVIIGDLAKLADILEKKVELSLVNLEAIIGEIIEKLKSKGKIDEDIHIEREISIGNFYSDDHLIRLAIEKIIENAATYQNPAVADKNILIRTKFNNGKATVEIEDNGLGIDDQELRRVFEMFHRGSEQSTGSGLGLYIAKLAIEKIDGKIEIASIPSMGTMLSLSIPVLQEHQKRS